MKKINLFNLNKKQIYIFFNKIKENKFKANQIINLIYKKYHNNFNFMNIFDINLKNKLFKYCSLEFPRLIKKKISVDGTLKLIFCLKDNKLIETIYIPEKKRKTLCITTQVGCKLKCKFCATGKKFIRNLKIYEIIIQIWYIKKILKKRNKIFNIVFMGMGEPLLNFNNLIKSLKIILDNNFLKISKKKITLSTSGICDKIIKLKKIDLILTISLHSSNDFIRNNIMPINKKYSIKNVLKTAYYYINNSKTNKNILSIEYILIDHINDYYKNSFELHGLLKQNIKINLIKFNIFFKCFFINSFNIRIYNFNNFLKKKNRIVNIRKTRGIDINASCGQLIASDKWKR